MYLNGTNILRIRKKGKTFILISCLFIISSLFLYSVSNNNLLINNTEEEKNYMTLLNSDNLIKNFTSIYYKSVTKASVIVNKHITKSLSELGTTPSTNFHMLFFNRVPKCGSEMLVLLITWLQGLNGFKHFRLPGGKFRGLSRLKQEEVVEKVKSHAHDSAVPTSFDRHIYFTNFSSFGIQNPIYINLIRDPIDKMVSRYYYTDLKGRKEDNLFDICVEKNDPECLLISGEKYDLTIPYFCGHELWCKELNNKQALETAKLNVEKYFHVVGVLEHLNETLSTLEYKIPQYFKGLQNIYFNELLEPHRNKNKNNPRDIKSSTKQKLQLNLKLEYEFYHFIKSRLLNQYSLITKHNNNN